MFQVDKERDWNEVQYSEDVDEQVVCAHTVELQELNELLLFIVVNWRRLQVVNLLNRAS
jgi:hypothetical protein